MADFFCDISAIGNEYQAYADTPTTWGVPQDGNGRAGPGHSAAVAIATIDVAGCSASGTGTIGVLGVTVSSTLNASGSALATAIANAINAATTTANTSTISSLGLALNRIVFARVDPGLNTRVQIMMRIAGTDWNGMTPTQANISPAATIGAFSGGADGPFAYIMQTNAVFGRTAITGYGIWTAAAAGVTDPGMTDVIHVRTRRSGVDFAIEVAPTNNLNGHNWRATNYLYDNGTVWPGDNGKLTATLFFNSVYSSLTWNIGINGSAGATVSHVSRGYRNLDLIWRTNSGSSIHRLHSQNSDKRSVWVRCGIIQYGITNSTCRLYDDAGGTTTNVTAEFLDCFIHCKQVLRTYMGSSASGSTGCYFKFNGTVVEIESATAPIAALCSIGTAGQNKVEYIGGRIYDTNGVYNCASPFSINAGNASIEAICDSVFGVTDVYAGFTASVANQAKLIWSSPEGPYKGFRHETPQFVVDWKGDGTFPHCGAQRLTGDYWSHRVTWTSAPTLGRSVTPLKLAVFHRTATAVRTVRVDLFTPDATPFYLDEFDVAVSYIDDTGTARTEWVAGTNDRALSGSASRQLVPEGGATWTANGVVGYTGRKFELTTQYPVAQNTEITVRVGLCAPRGTSIVFYVSPRVVVT